MAGKNVSLFKGILTVAAAAVIIFLVIYFFFPDTSYKYFGTAANIQKAVEDSFASVFYKVNYLSGEEKDKLSSYLSSADGKAFLKNISSAVAGGRDAVADFTSSESFRNFQKTMSESLSAESLQKLSHAINNAASSFLTAEE